MQKEDRCVKFAGSKLTTPNTSLGYKQHKRTIGRTIYGI